MAEASDRREWPPCHVSVSSCHRDLPPRRRPPRRARRALRVASGDGAPV